MNKSPAVPAHLLISRYAVRRYHLKNGKYRFIGTNSKAPISGDAVPSKLPSRTATPRASVQVELGAARSMALLPPRRAQVFTGPPLLVIGWSLTRFEAMACWSVDWLNPHELSVDRLCPLDGLLPWVRLHSGTVLEAPATMVLVMVVPVFWIYRVELAPVSVVLSMKVEWSMVRGASVSNPPAS